MTRFNKILVVFVLLIIIANIAWSAEDDNEKTRYLSINFVLLDSLGFAGLGVEAYLADLIGLGAAFTALPLGANGEFVMFYEIEGYARFYFGGPNNSLFLGGNVGYCSAIGNFEDTFFSLDGNALNLSPTLGYNVFMGKQNNARFSVEIGPRITTIFLGQEATEGFLVNVLFQLMFGMNVI